MNATTQIAKHFKIDAKQITRCEEWKNVYFVVIAGKGGRFVSKKVVKTEKAIEVGSKIQASIGDKFSGKYMGYAFAGILNSIEASESGYHCDRNYVRLCIKLSSPIFWENGSVRSEAGESLIMDCVRVSGGIERQDGRYSELKKYIAA